MKIRTNHPNLLDNALAAVNKQFDGNVVFKQVQLEGTTRDGRTVTTFTLKIKDSYGAGASVNARTGRHICAACWHVHGELFDAIGQIDPEAEIKSTNLNGRAWTLAKFHGWNNYNVGSQMSLSFASENCECGL